MDALIHRLAALADSYFPPTPNVVASVVSRLPERDQGYRRWYYRQQRFVLVPALALAFAVGALAFSPAARSLAVVLLQLDRVTIERRLELEVPLELQPLPLGERVSLTEARRRASFTVVVPRDYDAVYLDYRPSGTALTFVWGPPSHPRLLLTEFVGRTEAYFLYKQAGPATSIEELRLWGRPAFWVSGAPHLVYYRYGDVVDQEELYLAGNVLIWQRGRVTLRLEGASREAALAIAAD